MSEYTEPTIERLKELWMGAIARTYHEDFAAAANFDEFVLPIRLHQARVAGADPYEFEQYRTWLEEHDGTLEEYREYVVDTTPWEQGGAA